MTRLSADVSVARDGSLAGLDPTPDTDRARSGIVVVLRHRIVDVVDETSGRDEPPGHTAPGVGSTVSVLGTASPPGSMRTTILDPTCVTAARERAKAATSDSGKESDLVLTGHVRHGRLGDAGVTGRRSGAVRHARRPGRRDTTGHRRSAAPTHAAEREIGIDRDALGGRRLPVTR